MRCWLKRFAATLLAVMVTTGLYGCGGGAGGPSGGFFSGAGSFFSGSKQMSLAPIIGAPQSVSQQLSQALVDAGKERNLTIIPGGSAEYTLRGYLVAANERKSSKVSYIWDVTDSKGTRVVRVSGEEAVPKKGSDPWSAFDSAALRSLAGKTTSQLSAALGGGSSTASTSSPGTSPAPVTSNVGASTPPGEVMVIVPPVTGAPGDGERSLTAALKKRLYAAGIKLAGGAAGNVYTVKGSVSLAESSGGKQSIRIDWQVIDPGGKRLGTVSQQNMIPKNSLNGPWGAIADAAANAAADGIIKLLPKSKG